MRFEQLVYFIELAKHKSFSQASKDLYISQQSLSKSMNELEKELNVTLINRNNKGITLTEEGMDVLVAAQDIIDRIDILKNKYRSSSKTKENQTNAIRILGCSAVYLTILPEVIQELQEQYPSLTIMSMEQESYAIPDIQKDLYQKDASIPVIGIINQPNTELFDDFIKEHGLYFQPIYKTRFVVFVNKQSPLANMKKISMKTLLNYPGIVFTPSYVYRSIDSLMFEKYGTLKMGVVVDSMVLLKQALERNKGFSLLPIEYENIPQFMDSNKITHIEVKENLSSFIGCVLAEKDIDNE